MLQYKNKWEEWDLNLRNTNVADLQSAAFDRLAILPLTNKHITNYVNNTIHRVISNAITPPFDRLARPI